jgi:hypothetical protein
VGEGGLGGCGLGMGGNATIEQMGEFLVDVGISTISGLAGVMKDTATQFLDSTRQKIVTTATATATSAVTNSTAIAATLKGSSSGLVDNGVGIHWLRNLLGRSEWTLPCVGVKLVL